MSTSRRAKKVLSRSAKLRALRENEKRHKDKINTARILKKIRHESAALTIQKYFRGYITRKNYQIKPLNEESLTSTKTYMTGNDPLLPPDIDRFHEEKEKIAIVATSGLRIVSLACRLAFPKNKSDSESGLECQGELVYDNNDHIKHLPKIFLLDRSKLVHQFWSAFKKFLNDDRLARNVDLFFENLPDFVRKNSDICEQFESSQFHVHTQLKIKYPPQNLMTYFEALLGKYDYNFVRALILHTSLLKESWSNPSVFTKLNNIIEYLGIKKVFAYPSNIVLCSNSNNQNKILDNIASLKNVVASIHSNLCKEHRFPHKIYVLDNQNPDQIKAAITASEQCWPPKDHQDFKMSSAFLFLSSTANSLSKDITIKEDKQVHCQRKWKN